jgi:hypothetical protein
MRDGFHWSNGLYFRRLSDGTVEVTQTKHTKTDEIAWQYEIPPSEWASIVAAVSYQGETRDTYGTALGFHGCSYEGLEKSRPPAA